MVDTVQIHIPMEDIFFKKVSKTAYEIIGDVSDYGLNPASRRVVKQDDGSKIAFDLYHMQESIPTSHTGIGFKFMHRTNNCKPHVILNASIAKITQGHNIYGITSIIAGCFEMLGLFIESFPKFSKYFVISLAEISKLDITLPVQTTSLMTAERIREYMRYVDWGRFRNLSVRNKKLEYNTIYFGSPNSKVGGFKLYCKGVEISPIVNELKKNAQKGCLTSNYKLTHIYTPETIDYAMKSVRIEATAKKRMLKEHNIPTNLWDFIVYQLNNPDIYKTLFQHKTRKFLSALEGLTMTHTDDIKVYDLLHEKLTTITPTGKKSSTRAKHAYNFYKRLKDDGFQEVKRCSNERTFQRNIKSLADAGFSRAYLQNLSKNEETPILRLLNMDFDAPLPASYKPPKTRFFNKFDTYLNNAVQRAA